MTFEAFDPLGISLGLIGAFVLGDGTDTGQTACLILIAIPAYGDAGSRPNGTRDTKNRSTKSEEQKNDERTATVARVGVTIPGNP